MNSNRFLIEFYIREVLKTEKTNKLIVEQMILLESGYINEGLYDKIKSLGKYSKNTALILTMLISSGISSSYAQNNPNEVAKALNNTNTPGIENVTSTEVEEIAKDLTRISGLGSTITGSGGPESSGLQTVSEIDVSENKLIKEIDRDIKKLAADKKIKSIHYSYKVIITKARHNVNLSDNAIAKIKDIASLDIAFKSNLDKFPSKFKKFAEWVNSDDPNLVSLDYLASAISLFEVCKIMKEDCIKTLKNINKGANYKAKLTSKEASVSDITGKRYSKGNGKFKKLQQDDNPYFEFFMLKRRHLIEKLHNAVKSDNMESFEWSNLTKKIFVHCISYKGVPVIRNINAITNFFEINHNKHEPFKGIENMEMFNLGNNFSLESVGGVGGADDSGGIPIEDIKGGVASSHHKELKKSLGN